MDYLANLNEFQRRAVEHTEGPLLILAGAGSGKTRVITHRIAKLLVDNKVHPDAIFAVTFTNKAAEEMKKRVVGLIGPEGSRVFIKTFHSAGVSILRRFGQAAGISNNFSIYDQSDQASIIKELLLEWRLDPKKIRPESLVSKISEIKDRAELIEGADPSAMFPTYPAFDFADLYREYHARLAARNALDFNDLLIRTVDLFRKSPEVLSMLQRRWRYFMIDEYQDTNYAQYLMAKYLASATKNICVVGDDDQSIYSWRGADIRNILNFEKDYPGAETVTLEYNYRSREPILAAAAALIANNVNRKPKNLRASRGEGERVVWARANNEYGEAEFVVNAMRELRRRDGMRNGDFAVFYRTNAQSRVFEDQLRREGIPYRVVGGLKFYDRKEVKDVLAYLKFIVNTADMVSLNRIINTPARGIGNATLERIEASAKTHGVSAWAAIRDGLVEGRLPEGVRTFKKIIEESADILSGGQGLFKTVERILTLTGYRKSLEEERTDESQSRLENIDELMNGIYAFESTEPGATLEQFLQEIALYTSEEDPEEPGDRNNCVTLMTVHNAKGLEFPAVFLTGLEEDMFPHRLASDTDEGVEEERRLCYVGITRAMEVLYLTGAELRRSYGEIQYRRPSRFVEEIPAGMLDVRWVNSAYSGMDRPRPTTNGRDSAERPPSAAPARASDSKFAPGQRVSHPRYGLGQVTRIEGSGDNVKLTIRFPGGTKTFVEKYTPLERA